MRTTLTSLLLLFLAAGVSSAQDLDWKKLVERGEYAKLADKLEPYLDSSKADEKLRFYLDSTLGYLRRGAKAKISGSEIVLVRGAKNDRLYQMPQAGGRKRKDNHEGLFEEPHLYPSGGPRLFVPNRIRYMRRSWDDRLPAYQDYFTEATDLLGGNGSALPRFMSGRKNAMPNVWRKTPATSPKFATTPASRPFSIRSAPV